LRLELLNTVVLAEDYARLRDWYIQALDLELQKEWTEDYHYAELVREGKYVVGVAAANEMRVAPHHPRNNTSVMQLQTDDIEALFARVKEQGGEIHGPSYEAKEKFHYGSFRDPEGNEVWVVQTL